jgi:chaperone BCS1
MFSSNELPSPSSLFSAYASMAASVMLFRSMANELIPYPIRTFIFTTIRSLFSSNSIQLTLIFDESTGMARNQVFEASEVYLCTKISPNTERLKVSKTPKEKTLTIRLEKGEKIVDVYEGIELKWMFVCAEPEKQNPNDNFPSSRNEKRYFQLSFNKRHKDFVLNNYLPSIIESAKQIVEEQRVLKMFTLNNSPSYGGIKWESINLEHPATFETIAMEFDLKNAVMEDLDRFVRRKEFYKRVGKAWKRGYLLYGPPGTGKSSLVAAMANYLKFDVYDLQLANIMRDSDLRRLLLATGNRSILVIEDIDCSVDLPDRNKFVEGRKPKDVQVQLTLSGLLNFIDGLWSSCGDERIIIFTTNHKERLDPALLRPGRMDMHIHMSYCTAQGFRLLASNYLNIKGNHPLFGELEGLIENTEITPAQIAEELMKSEVADVALEGLVNLLKRKRLEGNQIDEEEAVEEKEKASEDKYNKMKKIEKKRRKSVRLIKRKGAKSKLSITSYKI